MKSRPLASLILLLVLAAPASGAEWVRVETRNFIVYGDTGEKRVREVASEFERFREALGRVITGAGTPAAVPTVVVVFGSQRAFETYSPRFNGKPVKVNGYFSATEDTNIVAFADGDRTESLRTIFHEYVHLVIANMSHGMPTWLNEGLAEYYSTFRVEDNGRRAVIGGLIPSHLHLLNRRRPMAIADLLAVEQSSADYNEGERQSLFYAQSWALVHMLVSGTGNRSAALAEYSGLVSSGTPSLDAWNQVFGDEQIIQSLQNYVGQSVMKGLLYRFERDIPRVKGDSSTVSRPDTEAVFADLLRHVAPHEEASAYFERAIALEPPSARARVLYGLHIVDRDAGKARALLMAASGDTSDWLTQYFALVGLTRLADRGRDADPAVLEAARVALGRVLSARPDLPNAMTLRARLDSMDATDLTPALTSIRRARDLAPGREDYRMLESYILARRGEYVAARSVIQPLLTAGYSAHVTESAHRMIQQIDRAERTMEAKVARLEGRSLPGPAGAGEGGDVSVLSVVGLPADAARTPVFRKTEAGEGRLEGHLERISCTSEGAVLHVAVEKTVERFDATTLDGIDFISHRTDLASAITCGARTPPDHVYVTFRTGKVRQIIAVEFLPR